MSKTWKIPPSQRYQIKDEVAAFFFDRAVTLFGMAVEEDINQATKQAKTEQESQRKAGQILANWLGVKQKFRDPAARVSPDQSGPVSL